MGDSQDCAKACSPMKGEDFWTVLLSIRQKTRPVRGFWHFSRGQCGRLEAVSFQPAACSPLQKLEKVAFATFSIRPAAPWGQPIYDKQQRKPTGMIVGHAGGRRRSLGFFAANKSICRRLCRGTGGAKVKKFAGGMNHERENCPVHFVR